MRNDRITLKTEYANAQLNVVTSSKNIYADVQSVARSEYYAAYVAGLSPRYRIDIDPADYDSGKVVVSSNTTFPNKVTVDGNDFLIIRAYKKNQQHMELTVG